VAFGKQIVAAAQHHHLDPRLLAAVAAQETGGPQSDSGRNIVGDDGHGHGLFQIDDRWHPFAQTSKAMDPAANAEYAAQMLSGLVQTNGGDVHAALAAYNSGSPHGAGTRTRWADGSILGYADSVLRHYQRISAAPASAGTIAATRDTQMAALAESSAPIVALRSLAAQLGSLGSLPASSASATCPALPTHKKSDPPTFQSASILAPGDDETNAPIL